MPGKASTKKGKQQAATPSVQKGDFIFPNGETYVGEYTESSTGEIERNGEGVHISADGTVFSGVWGGDRLSGEGEVKYPSGASYKGSIDDSSYHGTGTYTWPDGSSYTGDFVHGRLEGRGEFTDSAGRVWTGSFSGKTANALRLKLA